MFQSPKKFVGIGYYLKYKKLYAFEDAVPLFISSSKNKIASSGLFSKKAFSPLEDWPNKSKTPIWHRFYKKKLMPNRIQCSNFYAI